MKTECKGLFFRGHRHKFVTERPSQTIVGEKVFLTTLKKRSCSGCEECRILEGAINSHLLSLHGIEDKAVYRICKTKSGVEAVQVPE